MNGKAIREPSAEHPIVIEPAPRRVVVTAGDRVIASSAKALSLREASYPPVLYFPRADVDMSLLERSEHTTYCPYKGDCSYFSIPAAGERGANAVWTYEAPYRAVEAIKDHLAFYPDRVEFRTE